MLISCETFRYLLSLFGVLDCIDLRSSQVPEMPLQAFFGSCEKAKQGVNKNMRRPLSRCPVEVSISSGAR